MNIRRETEQNTLPVAVVIAALLAYVFHLLRYVHNDIWGSIYSVYYPFLIPVLIAFTVYFRWGKWKKEEKLFLLFAVWVYISRLLNGDFFLANDADIVLNTGLSYVFVVICIALNRESRERFLDGISILTSGYFTLLSLLGLYAWLLRRELYNPLTGEILCTFEGGWMCRLVLFWKSSNEVALWFFLSLCLLVYLFLRKKTLYWRIPILLAAIPNYLALTVTYCRSARLAATVSFALLLLLFLLNRLPRRRGTRLLAGLACMAITAPLIYASFNTVAAGMQDWAAYLADSAQKAYNAETVEGSEVSPITAWIINDNAVPLTATGNTKNPVEQLAVMPTVVSIGNNGVNTAMKAEPLSGMKDDRGFNASGRLEIYKSIIPTMRQEPLRLLRGCLCKDVMKIANPLLPNFKPHFHNTFLQALCLTGLPGLLLILVFCGLLAVRIIRLFFSEAPVEVKSLTLVLIGSFIYNMLEVSLFFAADTRAFVAYIVAGAVLAYSHEGEQDCCPAE